MDKIYFLKKIIVIIITLLPLICVAQTPKNAKKKPLNQKFIAKNIRKSTYDQDENKLNLLITPVYKKIISDNVLITEEIAKLKTASNRDIKDNLQHRIDSISGEIEKLKTQTIKIQLNFIEKNTSSFFSLDRLSSLLKLNAEDPIVCDTIESLFNNLSKSVISSSPGREFKSLLARFKKNKLGSLAPDFKTNDLNAHSISLSSFRHKNLILLDFWASWCKPCREEMAFLKDMYREYKEKGLEIIGISKDYKVAEWKNAIAQDSTQSWIQIFVPDSYTPQDSSITNKYFVYGIPVKVLINKDGIIIGRWSGSGDKNMEQLKKLLNKQIGN